MKKSLHLLSIATVLTLTSISSQAATDNLVYVAVDPCRLADTRDGRGVISANTSRKFLVSGAAGALDSQGGNAAGCEHPRTSSGLDPVAVTAYIVAVPTGTSTSGLLTAFPSDQADPDDSIATVNFAAGQVIGNTTTATLCQGSSCPAEGPLAVITHNTEQDVVIDVQGYFYPTTGNCPDDMVANGDGCIDKYEASVWDAATGGSQLNLAGAGGTDDILCNDDGSDCGATAANPIYARSEPSVPPSARITWYQAAQACANMGKRLPTTAEWQMAASGTPTGTGPDCNAGDVGTIASTDANPTCISSTGALNMVGNVWEFTADLDTTMASGAFGSTDALRGVSLGQDFANSGGGVPSTTSVFGVVPTDTNAKVGFRCAR